MSISITHTFNGTSNESFIIIEAQGEVNIADPAIVIHKRQHSNELGNLFFPLKAIILSTGEFLRFVIGSQDNNPEGARKVPIHSYLGVEGVISTQDYVGVSLISYKDENW